MKGNYYNYAISDYFIIPHYYEPNNRRSKILYVSTNDRSPCKICKRQDQEMRRTRPEVYGTATYYM